MRGAKSHRTHFGSVYRPNPTAKRVFTDDEYHDRFLPNPYLVPYAHALCSEPPSLVPALLRCVWSYASADNLNRTGHVTCPVTLRYVTCHIEKRTAKITYVTSIIINKTTTNNANTCHAWS